jgi:hypothetical protein
MDNDSTLNPQLEQEIAQLEAQLREVATASRFLESAEGRLWMEIATKEINRIVKDITSDKYRKDHTGYNNALSDLSAYRNMVKKMQLAASPVRATKINEKLESLTDGQ